MLRSIHVYIILFMPELSKIYFSWTARWKQNQLPIPLSKFTRTELRSKWEAEGIELLSLKFSEDRAFVVIASYPDLSPEFLAQRCKGRLDHALRRYLPEFGGFDRTFYLRTLGQNTREIVQNYIHDQVDASNLVDPLFRKRLKELRFCSRAYSPSLNAHAAVYDLFYHVILVTGGRYRMGCKEAEDVFSALLDGARVAKNEMFEISVMPDHVHMLLGGSSERSPESIVAGLKKESGLILRRTAFWSGGGYIGSVGPYRLRTALDRNREKGWVKKGW